MTAEGGNGNRMYLKVGGAADRLILPHSQVCIDWGVAGRAVNVALVENGAAELLHDDGSPFPLPVVASEVGILTDSAGRHYVPTQMLVIPRTGLDGLC